MRPAPARSLRPAGSPPLRLAFVGQAAYFAYCSLEQPAAGVVPAFVDFRAGADAARMRAELDAFEPDAVLVFRPEIIPAGAFDGLSAVTIGFLTEPIPRGGAESHPDLERRLDDLRMITPDAFDRIVSFDPLVAATADQIVRVWRSLPLPVSDRFFLEPDQRADEPTVLFTGRSTNHREWFLGPAKHDYDVIHLVHGITDEKLLGFLREVDVGLNLHNEPYPSFENRICVYAAAGLLVVTEELSPRHGLEPGIDYVEIRDPAELASVLHDVRRDPRAYRRIRVRGRMKAERFRASRVYPELLWDAFHDIRAFGSPRGRSPSVGPSLGEDGHLAARVEEEPPGVVERH